jgi:uncharacterized protein
MKLRALVAALLGLLLFCFAPAALASYVPPPMTGHVTDPAGRVSGEMVEKLNAKLESYRLRSGNELAVFFPATLDGYSVDDVGFQTARAWKLGAGKNDNGVLLVIAPVERKVRIEVGKGVEGALTDLQSNDIIQKMKPRLRSGEWGLAADEGTDQIIAELDSGGAKSAPAGHGAPKPATAGDVIATLVLLAIIFGIPILFVIGIASAIGRAFTSNGRGAYRGWSSGSSWSNDSSWSSGGGSSWSSSDSGGSSFGSDFSGGGGDFGGGGSSDSF